MFTTASTSLYPEPDHASRGGGRGGGGGGGGGRPVNQGTNPCVNTLTILRDVSFTRTVLRGVSSLGL
jgi:hypothetical protein